jgi:hypothetical protein
MIFNFCFLFLIYLIIFVLISKLLRSKNIYFGGEFNLVDFLNSLRKKYILPEEHIEVELKLKHSYLFDKIENYIRNHKHFKKSNTINYIWSSGIIKTIKSDGKIIWSIKKRLSNYNLPLGKITISLEKDTHLRETNEPILIRNKNRISAPLDKYWMIDYTEVNGNIEVEFEYIADDYWNAPNHINKIEDFLDSFNL